MVKMLTIDQIAELYQNGIEIKFRRKKHPYNLKGEYDPGLREVNLYAPSIDSIEDRDITILHELIHARNDIRSVYAPEIDEFIVEKEALETYHNRPSVLQFIKELYTIK